MLPLATLESILQTLPRLRIGLVGDLFLDRYLELAPEVYEVSIETGLEAYQIPSVRNSPGALGTVLNNLAALGVGQLVPTTVLGDDGHGFDLLRSLDKLPVDKSHIVTDPKRLTPTYTKPMRRDAAGVWQELNRLDVRSRGPLPTVTSETLIRHVQEVFRTTDGLIVLDQVNETNWGVVSTRVREAISELSRDSPEKLIFIDSRQHLGEFRYGVLKGNRGEILRAAGLSGEVSAEVEHVVLADALRALAARTGRPAYCTAGERGIYVAGQDLSVELVPGYPVTGPVDIVGAGDAATSGIVTALLSGASFPTAAAVGNLVASITVQQLGTTGTASPAQVRARWHEVGSDSKG